MLSKNAPFAIYRQHWTFEARTKIDAIGARLHEIEVRETYMDGGRSQQGIIDDLRAANADLQRLVTS